MIMRRLIAAMLMATMAVAAVQAQDKTLMQSYQEQLSTLLQRVATAPTDNERYLASEQAVQTLANALEEEGAEGVGWGYLVAAVKNYVNIIIQ